LTTKYEDIHRDVIESCMKGDVRAQYQLYSLYSKAMYNICFRMTGQQEEAEDMLQESFTYAFSKLGSFRFESSFGAWL
jgi:RNA polymerase sigma factor (sigma-70 family)